MDDLDFNKRLAEEMRALGYSDAALFAKEAMRAVFRLADARYQPRADVRAAGKATDSAPTSWSDPRLANDPNKGRMCGHCGGIVPAGTRYSHGIGLCVPEKPVTPATTPANPPGIPDGSPAPQSSSAPDDATEEAIGIVARANSVTDEFVRSGIDKYPSGVFGHLVREIAAALRRRSGVRIGTGRIARTLLHTSPNGCKWYGERHSDGTIGLSWQAGTQSAGIGVPPDAFRATVALMARDGEGSK